MGYQLETQLAEDSPIVNAFHRSSELLFKRMINPLLTSDFVFEQTRLWRELRVQLQLIHSLMDRIIEQRDRQLKTEQQQPEQEKQPRILLDAMLLAGLNRQQIRDEVNTFVFAVSFHSLLYVLSLSLS